MGQRLLDQRQVAAGRSTPPDRSHAVALEYFLTRGAQLCAVLLQARLDGAIVAQLLTAKPRGIARTRLLLL
jgi:hypothetical protein